MENAGSTRGSYLFEVPGSQEGGSSTRVLSNVIEPLIQRKISACEVHPHSGSGLHVHSLPVGAIPGTVMFFEGDQINDEADREDLGGLIDPLRHLEIMQDKFPAGWRVLV